MWPDCSPPSDRAALQHLLHHVLVADRRAHQIDAERLQRQLEADVAHHGRDDRVALQPALALQLAAAHQQHGVAVDDPAALVDEDRAIAVAVERHAHRAAARHDGLAPAARDASIRSRRLMLRPSGRSPITIVSKPRLSNSSRRHRRRRAVGAVDARS